MREDDNRSAVFQVLDIVFHPFELFAAKRAKAAGLQIENVHQADKVRALVIEAVPASPFGAFSVSIQVLLSVVVEYVVFARHEKTFLGVALFNT